MGRGTSLVSEFPLEHPMLSLGDCLPVLENRRTFPALFATSVRFLSGSVPHRLKFIFSAYPWFCEAYGGKSAGLVQEW